MARVQRRLNREAWAERILDMELDLDQLHDRRSAPRLEVDLRLWFSDYDYEWEACSPSISLQGCFIETSEPFEPGKELEVRLVHPDGDELKLDSIVRWNRQDAPRVRGGMGVVFDLRKRETAEQATDFVERLALEDILLATRYRDALRPMGITTVLQFARGAPEKPVLTDAERTFLAWVDGQRDLRGIREVVGTESWESIRYAPFSLCGKGVLTRDQSLAGKAPQKVRRTDAGPAPAVGAAEVASRNWQAHLHYERALGALESSDKRRALTELRLALMLAPGDAEITEMLAEVEDE